MRLWGKVHLMGNLATLLTNVASQTYRARCAVEEQQDAPP